METHQSIHDLSSELRQAKNVGMSRTQAPTKTSRYTKAPGRRTRTSRAQKGGGWYEYGLFDMVISLSEVPLREIEQEFRDRVEFSPVAPSPVDVITPPPVVLKFKPRPKPCAPPHPLLVKLSRDPPCENVENGEEPAREVSTETRSEVERKSRDREQSRVNDNIKKEEAKGHSKKEKESHSQKNEIQKDSPSDAAEGQNEVQPKTEKAKDDKRKDKEKEKEKESHKSKSKHSKQVSEAPAESVV